MEESIFGCRDRVTLLGAEYGSGCAPFLTILPSFSRTTIIVLHTCTKFCRCSTFIFSGENMWRLPCSWYSTALRHDIISLQLMTSDVVMSSISTSTYMVQYVCGTNKKRNWRKLNDEFNGNGANNPNTFLLYPLILSSPFPIPLCQFGAGNLYGVSN